MSDYGIYSTGWYSISPSFAWWRNRPLYVAQNQARRKTKEIARKEQERITENKRKIPQGTISIYA